MLAVKTNKNIILCILVIFFLICCGVMKFGNANSSSVFTSNIEGLLIDSWRQTRHLDFQYSNNINIKCIILHKLYRALLKTPNRIIQVDLHTELTSNKHACTLWTAPLFRHSLHDKSSVSQILPVEVT